MDQIHVIRHKVLVEGEAIREVAREMGVARNTVRRYLADPPPGVRQEALRSSPVADAVRPRLHEMLASAPRWTGGKQRLTSIRLHQLLAAEGYVASPRLVRKMAEWKRQRQEVYVPLVTGQANSRRWTSLRCSSKWRASARRPGCSCFA